MGESIFNMLFSATSSEREYLSCNHMCTGMKLHMCIVSCLAAWGQENSSHGTRRLSNHILTCRYCTSASQGRIYLLFALQITSSTKTFFLFLRRTTDSLKFGLYNSPKTKHTKAQGVTMSLTFTRSLKPSPGNPAYCFQRDKPPCSSCSGKREALADTRKE